MLSYNKYFVYSNKLCPFISVTCEAKFLTSATPDLLKSAIIRVSAAPKINKCGACLNK